MARIIIEKSIVDYRVNGGDDAKQEILELQATTRGAMEKLTSLKDPVEQVKPKQNL